MTFINSMRTLARSIRGIPGALGLRPHRVFLVVETWSGAHPGDGVESRTETELVEGGNHPPKIRKLNDERLALSGLPQGSLEIGPVTVSHGGIGVTADQLRGVGLETNEALKLRISGPLGDAWYRISGLSLDRAIHWTITAQPVSELPADE